MQTQDGGNQNSFQDYTTTQDSLEADEWLDEAEEDDGERGFTDDPAFCPNVRCQSRRIRRFTTKAGHTVLHCQHCQNYFCLRCKSIQTNKAALDTQGSVIRCQKCGTRL